MNTFTNTAEGRMLALITGCAGLCIGLLKNVGVSLNPFEVNFRKNAVSIQFTKLQFFKNLFCLQKLSNRGQID